MTDVKTLDAALDLLDRQVLDANEIPIGKVDDVELSHADPGRDAPEMTALLLGPVAYGKRLGGRLGKSIAGAGERLAKGQGPIRIPVELIKTIGVSIDLAVDVSELDRPEDLDHWLRDHFISRIPGARHASE